MTKTTIEIKEMVESDIEDVLKIDQSTFTSSWTEEIFKHEVVENEYGHYFVVKADGRTIGYAGLWIVGDDAQVTNIALLNKYRGYKIGEKLFGFIVQHAIKYNVERLSLEVRTSNVIAQKMYSKFGLIPGGIRRNYYTDNGEDAIVMWVNLK